MNAADVVVRVIRLNGGEVNGRTRLQKMVFLLDRCGADLGLNFTYHYYGPYSSDLTDGWLDAKAEDRIHVEEKIGGYGVPYSVFRLKKSRIRRKDLGNLEPEEAEAATPKMREVSNTVLELAATMVFLQEEVPRERVIGELKALKPNKATDPLIAKAEGLLKALDLHPRDAAPSLTP